MSAGDMTTERVRALLREGAAAARLSPNPAPYDPGLICGCSHGLGAHHGPDGLGACGEAGCGCAGWHPADIECPDCGAQWPIPAGVCPSCGLTVDEIAYRLALARIRQLAKGETE